MIRRTVPEFGRIQRASVPGRLLRRLQAFDERNSAGNQKCVFDWSHLTYIRALNYVGVVQVPGLCIEVLPKIDSAAETFKDASEKRVLAQRNLLYMLAFTRRIPVRERELASLRLQKMPLLEAVIRIFCEKLLAELGRGLHRAYVPQEANSTFFKGKLLVAEHLRRNVVQRQRVFVGYEDFIADTWLNRILRATCHRLLGVAASSQTQKCLREALLMFADVSDRRIQEHHFAEVHLNRSTERFNTLLDFCRIVLFGSSPTPGVGSVDTFSLLFPMETLFEEFIAQFIRRHSEDLDLDRHDIHVQTAGRRRWLLSTPTGAGRFRLRPDIVIDTPNGKVRTIIDTKWKRLKADHEDANNGVSQGDLYQLYAYAHRYGCDDNVLLYPRAAGLVPKHYVLAGESGKSVRIEFVDLNRDLARAKDDLCRDLRRVLWGGEDHSR